MALSKEYFEKNEDYFVSYGLMLHEYKKKGIVTDVMGGIMMVFIKDIPVKLETLIENMYEYFDHLVYIREEMMS